LDPSLQTTHAKLGIVDFWESKFFIFKVKSITVRADNS